MQIQFGRHCVDLSTPQVMGILNVTPDSFYDGGEYFRNGNDISPALRQAEKMVDAGARFIDIGGESTRPGAEKVGVEEEMTRVLPVVEAICQRFDVVVSLDTSRPEVIAAGVALGAGLINDVRALQHEGALAAAKESRVPVCLMHMQGQPQNMQDTPSYGDVVTEVAGFLQARASACLQAGIDKSHILLDPGFGFGKTDAHNIALLKQLSAFKLGGFPILVGLSRKSILGRLLGREVEERLAGSLALAQYALHYGANILRVHDVAETIDIINMFKILNLQKED
ncbi:dihydropteroate synthase [Agarilytica rhodophyticola]|uniref:dihydropteroate synthase n=1 Tax=Agarilytica rhodophyticola TaxID=1737490 RepID=UPI000B349F29|nr:dihydropteroate synthase [Agarilytica rhodophyticola]